MKQYLSQEQTAKLIELGFERPKSEVKAEQAGDCAWYNPAYSIGELIEMLGIDSDIEINRYGGEWSVDVGYTGARGKELIDCLFECVVELKELV